MSVFSIHRYLQVQDIIYYSFCVCGGLRDLLFLLDCQHASHFLSINTWRIPPLNPTCLTLGTEVTASHQSLLASTFVSTIQMASITASSSTTSFTSFKTGGLSDWELMSCNGCKYIQKGRREGKSLLEERATPYNT